ncbi:hypothetical protein BDV59DRAFT_185468 [Aspergillus ambiguus]|uniref:uncharacterized protein n=1 Tax=Aspergillus ambiguus TaxID=176160 RepID=UPI003CCE00A6
MSRIALRSLPYRSCPISARGWCGRKTQLTPCHRYALRRNSSLGEMNDYRYTIQVEGPDGPENQEHKDHLLAQLKDTPRDIRSLQLTKGTPSDTEWSLLGNHFTNIKDLELHAGFNEDLNDAKLPTHWPLERLLVSDSGAEVFRTPFVLEGRVRHLILLLTYGLRFEGPTCAELSRANREAIKRGEKEPKYIGNIEVTFMPDLVREDLRKRYASFDAKPPAENKDALLLPKAVPTKMAELEILENDAMDTFTRMAIALPHVVENLSVLNIRSTSNDFEYNTEPIFPSVLSQLRQLNTFVFTVGEVFGDKDTLRNLYKSFPPNISTLRFRGPVTLHESSEWAKWVESFDSGEFLPKLKRLSLVLDLYFEPKDKSWSKMRRCSAPEEMLRQSEEACRQLYDVVRKRDVVVEPFRDQWSKYSPIFTQVDERWMQS